MQQQPRHNERSRGDDPFLESAKYPSQILWRQQESFHQLQPTLDPAQDSQLNNSLVRFYFPQRQTENTGLRAGLVHADEFPLDFIPSSNGPGRLSLTSTRYSWDQSTSIMNCLTDREFLNSAGPTMGFFPTNIPPHPCPLPRIWGDHVHWTSNELTPLWFHSYPNHVQL